MANAKLSSPELQMQIMAPLMISRRLSPYLPSAKAALSQDAIKTAQERRQGDDNEKVLADYAKVLAAVRAAPVAAPLGSVGEFLVGLPAEGRLRVFTGFRFLIESDPSVHVRVKQLLRVHADAFEHWHHGSDKHANARLLELFEIQQYLFETAPLLYPEMATVGLAALPTRPIDLAAITLGILSAVPGTRDLLYILQRVRYRRIGVRDVPEVPHPDQTTLCDFAFFSCCFYSYVARIWDDNSCGKRAADKLHLPAVPEAAAAEAAADPAPSAALAATVAKLLQRLAKCLASRRHVLLSATARPVCLYVHPLPAYVTAAEAPGRRFAPYVIDYVATPGVAAERIGQVYPGHPTALQLLRALLEHLLATGDGLPTAIMFPRAADALAALPWLQQLAPWQPIAASVSESLQPELHRALLEAQPKYDPEAVALSRQPSGAVAQPVAHWQWHTESFFSKGASLDPSYLHDWYAAATALYGSRAWLAWPDRVSLDVAVNGVGRTTAVFTGRDGSPPALHLFKSSRPVDFADAHWALVFTARAHVPFVDTDMVDGYGFAHPPDATAFPLLFRDHATFKRPAYQDLEMFRACCVVLPLLAAKLGLAADGTAPADPLLQPAAWAEHKFPLVMPGQRHPSQVTVTLPGVPQREAAAAADVAAADVAAAAIADSVAAASASAMALLDRTAAAGFGTAAALCASTCARLWGGRGVAEALSAVPGAAAALVQAVAGYAVGVTPEARLLVSEAGGPAPTALAACDFARALAAFQHGTRDGPEAAALLDAALTQHAAVYPWLALESTVAPLRAVTAATWDALPPSEQAARAVVAVLGVPLRLADGAAEWLADRAEHAIPLRPAYFKCAMPCCLRTGAAAEMRRCAGCKAAYYCSAACATAAWPTHKALCGRVKAANILVDEIEAATPADLITTPMPAVLST